MVVTRRGVRVLSPSKTTPDQPPDVQVTPPRRKAVRQVETQSGCTHLEEGESDVLAASPVCVLKRCSRASRLHSPEQHADTDTSEVESLCSAVSDAEPPARPRRRTKVSRRACQEDAEASEAESCSSAVSASSPGGDARRSSRRRTLPRRPDAAQASARDSSSRVTRSQRKAAPPKRTDDSELSDPDSHLSGVSGADAPKTADRRTARPRRQAGAVPVNADEAVAVTPVRQSSRVAARRKAPAAAEVSEPQSCDSEGFESGPVRSRETRRRRAVITLDSDSDLTDAQLPDAGSRSRRSGARRRTPSGGKSPEATVVSRRSGRNVIVVEESAEPSEDASLDDSRLESTVIAGDEECTLLEEDIEQDPKADEVDVTEEAKSEEDPRGVEGAAVAVSHQQGAPREESPTEELEEMREKASPEPSQTETGEARERGAAEGGADTDQLQGGEDDHDALDSKLCEEEEEMEAGSVESDDQQVVECLQVTSRQEHNVRVDSTPEEEPGVITIHNNKVISLLDSSEDEEEDEEEDEVMQVSDGQEERGAPSSKRGAADMAVDGLFMIDTRPGQQSDEQYYMEKATEDKKRTEDKAEQEEDDEEFVDEEGDDDDEDTDILYSSRNPLLKEMSSRIDPGIRVKELGGLYINFDGGKSKAVSSSLPKLKEKKTQDEVMKKSVIGADFEKKDAVPPYSESKQALKLKRRVEKEKTTGGGWFNMKAPELSQELKGDLQVLKMRGSLDSKRFYKKNDRDGFPKYFQVGTVVDSPADFYHSRLPKKARKRTMVEELLADAEFRHKNKKKYQQIVAEKTAQAAGKKNKRKGFHKKSNGKKQ